MSRTRIRAWMNQKCPCGSGKKRKNCDCVNEACRRSGIGFNPRSQVKITKVNKFSPEYIKMAEKVSK